MSRAMDFVAETLAGNGFRRIVTLNAEIAYSALCDKEIAELVNGADLVTPDGSGILWAAGKYGENLTERVCGIDLLTEMLKTYSHGGAGFYFLGAKPEIAEKAAAEIKRTYPGLKYCGYHDGYFGKENSEAMAAEVAASGADVLIAAMGAPFQDRWLAEYGERCGVKLGIGVGGSLDVISGSVKRAPALIQSLKLEWLYRTFADPSRWRRTMVLPKFMSAVSKDARNRK